MTTLYFFLSLGLDKSPVWATELFYFRVNVTVKDASTTKTNQTDNMHSKQAQQCSYNKRNSPNLHDGLILHFGMMLKHNSMMLG